MKQYLSFGAGVGSTALMLHLLDQGKEFETLFVDHETDLPETYEFVDYLQEQGYPITIIKPNYEGHSSLYEYCKFRKFLPSIYLRWCTYRFKLQPMWKYVKRPCVMYIGISYDEKHRATNSRKPPTKIENKYPLIEEQITRQGCLEIIKARGIRTPIKSGCWLCPFQSPQQLIWLFSNHKELFNKIVKLEKSRGTKHTLKDKPIYHYVPWKTEPLENFVEVTQ